MDMFKMTDTKTENEEPPSTTASTPEAVPVHPDEKKIRTKGLIEKVKTLFSKDRHETTLREAIEEFMDEAEENGDTPSVIAHERLLISNILKIRDMTVIDVMIPRADIVAVDINTSSQDLFALLTERQFSRLPVYRNSLDNVIGTLHIKDLLASVAAGKKTPIADLVRDVPIVSPAMSVLDLLLMMKKIKKHMVMVVDEFGGIDGLVTIGDVIEAIVGEIEDEYDHEEQPQMIDEKDGSIFADARVDLEEFEERFGRIIPEDDQDDIDTLGGLVCAIAGRVPARGEILTHKDTGIIFEILDADPRRVNRLRIKNIPNFAELH